MRLLLSLTLLSLMLACGGLGPSAPPAPSSGPTDPTGTWAEPHEILMIGGYDEEATCVADEGTWQAAVGCRFPVENLVIFTPNPDDTWGLTVEIVADNAHTCSFEGTAVRRGAGGFEATAPAEVYIPGEGGAAGRFEDGTCTLQIRITEGILTMEGDGEACQGFCGARAYMGIQGARRR
jgi:hypothetical protein